MVKKANNKKPNSDTEEEVPETKRQNNSLIPIIIGSLIFVSFYLQYKMQLDSRTYSSDINNSDIDYYEVLGVDSSTNIGKIKQKYRDLAKIWHPDRNPNCQECDEKFKLINKAYEIVSEEHRSRNSQQKSIFEQEHTELTTANWLKKVENSDDFWVIMVYESSINKHAKYAADVFDEVSQNYRNIAKFGTVDVLNHPNMSQFLPFKFQYFPNFITVLKDESPQLMENIDKFNVDCCFLISFFSVY